MNELIKINYDTEQPTVSARELHEKLNIGTAFKDWFPRMCEYGFEEGKDFLLKIERNLRERRKTCKRCRYNRRHGKTDLHDSEDSGRKRVPPVLH